MVDEEWTVRDLVAAGWSEADLEWERLSLQALSDLSEEKTKEACDGLGEALHLAKMHFSKGDPRLAASLTAQAAVRAVVDEAPATNGSVRVALQAWDDSYAAVATMTAPRRARSSLFHLRMEQRHRDTYAERWREESRKRLAELRDGLSEAEAPVLIGSAEARARLVHWRRERPPALDDSRKLLAAILLLAVNGTAAPEARRSAGLRH